MKIKNKKNKNDKTYLITISDKQCTRHLTLPKYIKNIAIFTSTSLALGLIISNFVVVTQKREIKETISLANSFEDTFVKLNSKNTLLNKNLKETQKQTGLMSETIAQMEQLSGVGTELSASLLDRITAISEYYFKKELDFEALDGRVNILEESIGLQNSEIDDVPMDDRIELASLGISQQKILLDSIPNGFPTSNSGVTSKFGKRIHPITKQHSFHNGIDLKAAMNTKIFATADGIVKTATNSKLSGKHITISHNFGFESRYAHLNKLEVTAGDVVQKGDIIGLTGKTGRVDGPHLHYEVRHLGHSRNPINFLTWEFGSQEIFNKERGIQWQSLLSLINKQISRPTLQLSQVAPRSRAQ